MEECPRAERGELGSRVQIQSLGLSSLSLVLQWKNGRTEADCDLGLGFSYRLAQVWWYAVGGWELCLLTFAICWLIECIQSYWLFIWLVWMSISRLLLRRVMMCSCKEKFCGHFINVFLASSPLCGGPSFLSSIFLWVDCLQHLQYWTSEGSDRLLKIGQRHCAISYCTLLCISD